MKRIFLILIGLGVLALGAVVALFWRPALDPIGPVSASAFTKQRIDRGAVLAGIGNCAACHTAQGGAAYAGGRPLQTPFGAIYATNITPDPATGIGAWSQQAFQRAMHQGVSRDGHHLFPVFPYTHFTLVSNDDIGALYAYFMTRPAVSAPAKANGVPFPLNVRAMQAGWKLLYFKQEAFVANPAKTGDWNRGAYLAEGLGHCAACHTPRNKLGAEIASAPYLGAKIDGWFAPALTAANTAPLPWTEAELFAFLRSGGTALHGGVAGPMADVVHNGLAKASDSDIHALAIYFADMNGSIGAMASTTTITALMAKSASVGGQHQDRGASLYLAACASCHANSNGTPTLARPELSLNSAMTASDPTNLVQVILHGVARGEGAPGLMMPGFAATLSDADIAELVRYLRRSRTTLPAWDQLETSIATVRKSTL